VLVDTSVWIDHLRASNATLVDLLEHARVWTHAFVVGELACGHLARRRELLTSLAALPHVSMVRHEEVLAFIDAHRLMGKGLGWIDMHLLAAATLAKVPLWTSDKRLSDVASRLGLQPSLA